MLAFLGHLVTTAGFRWPGVLTTDGLKWVDVPSGLAAFDKIPASGAWQIIVFIGLYDMSFTTTPGYQKKLEERLIFNSNWDEKTVRRRKAVELNNGRAAMMGILALMVHEKLDNNPYMLNPGSMNFNSAFVSGHEHWIFDF